ncbi:MAG TPA: hypothetical protein VEZ71_13350 [Archangium sp.]|nr:hypothetical protein [Archangium sp.]
MHHPMMTPWRRGALAALSLLTSLVCAPALANEGAWDQRLRNSHALRFDRDFDLYSTNNPEFPRASGTELELLPDNRWSAAGMAFLRRPLRPPFAVEFEYSIYDDDGGSVWNSGDGLALLFGRKTPSGDVQLPTGGDRGQVRDGSGYGVHLALYSRRRVVLTNGNGSELQSRSQPALYNHGRWSTLRVEVERRAIRVYLDGEPQLEWQGQVDDSYSGLALAAASGGADGRHAVRNLRIATRGHDGERPPRPNPPREDRDELLLNGGFEQPALAPGNVSYNDSIAGWRRSKGSAIEVQRHVAGSPAEGAQHLELDGKDSTGIFQDVATRPGAEYVLRLAFSARPGTPPRDNVLEVLWNGQVIERLQASGMEQSETRWRPLELRVRATSSTTRLELRDAGESNSTGTYVDAVSLQRVGGRR